MVNATIANVLNYTNVTSFSTLGSHINVISNGIFGISLMLMFVLVTGFVLYAKGGFAGMAVATFLNVIFTAILWALGWVNSEIMITSVGAFVVATGMLFFAPKQ